MAGKRNERPIIVKKMRRHRAHRHHAGAWKVAYADFVTAMMAFFLLMWLLNITTDEQKLGIANYFLPTPLSKSPVGSTGFSGGHSLETEGQLNGPPLSAPGVVIGLPPEEGRGDSREALDLDGVTDEQMAELAERAEQAELERVARELRRAIAEDPELAELGRNLMVDRTPEGVRIQILDQDQRSMFPLGSAAMYPYTRALMAKVVKVLAGTDRPVSLTGHTDAVPFRAGSQRDNWQLSADRANASRRALIEAGLPERRVARVTGKADTDPLNPDDPHAAENRRISIVLLRPPAPPSATPGVAGARRPVAAPARPVAPAPLRIPSRP